MNENQIERKLICILAADVAGYSRLMAADEEGTIRNLKSLQTEVLNPTAAKYNGEVVKLMGDGILMRFHSVVDAVGFGEAFQQLVLNFNSQFPEEKHIRFRIGINIGDVVVEEGDMFGDGVNIAARLEALSEPGGICVSGTVVDHVKGKLDVEFFDCGEQQVKNIPGKIRIYKSVKDGLTDSSIGESGTDRQASSPRNPEASGYPGEVGLAIPDRPSIAVLPFENMSTDPEQEFFSDGITEDIITALSKIDGLMVVARNSSFIYKNRTVDVKQVSEEQGVRYVLEGSVRKAGDRVRVTAQLVDATTGRHCWAERYDRKLEDIFIVQDQITHEVVTALDVNIGGGERVMAWRGTRNLEAWECVRRGMDVLNRVELDSMPQSERLFKKALQLDPDYAVAWAGLGWVHQNRAELRLGYASGEEREAAADKAIECGNKALELDQSCDEAYSLLGMCYLSKGEHDLALEMVEKAVGLAPGHAGILGGAAIVHCKSGKPKQALALIKKAIRLCPVYPSWFLVALGSAYRLTGNLGAAIDAFAGAAKTSAEMLTAHVNLASTLGEADRLEDAAGPVSEILRIDPEFSIKRYMSSLSYKDSRELERFEEGLRRVNLPD